MATSRTGTAKWKNLRRRALHQAQAGGLTNCPCTMKCPHHPHKPCQTPLDYTTGMRPNSATPDHKQHHALGGQDTLDNITIICRLCNSSDGGKLGRQQQLHKPRPQNVPTINFTTTQTQQTTNNTKPTQNRRRGE